MRIVDGLDSFREACGESPLPSSRIGSAGMFIDMAGDTDDSDLEIEDCYDAGSSIMDTDDGRLSRSLQTWMMDHKWSTVRPLEKPPREPVFSGKLGKDRTAIRVTKKRVQIREPSISKKNGQETFKQNGTSSLNHTRNGGLRRFPSDESIVTHLSLLTCSSLEQEKEDEIVKEKKKKKRQTTSRGSTTTSESEGFQSIWETFSSRRKNTLNHLLRTQNAMANDYGIIYAGGEYDDETEAFKHLDKEEQRSLFTAGLTRGLRFIDKEARKKSDSLWDLQDATENSEKGAPIVKTLSSDTLSKPWGKTLDISDLKREKMNRLVAVEQERLRKEKEKVRRGRRLTRKSSGSNMVDNPPPSPSHIGSFSALSETGKSHHSSENRAMSQSEYTSQLGEEEEEKPVTVWKGDREILEIDLKRELTQHVKERITSTRTALKRVTGYGESNARQETVGKNEEFPLHIEDDFCHKPRIIQKMRISPHLSGVIHDDIQVRMGRPRYHEIRSTDLDQWNKGQSLNRAHRNLKVFNWLHSLRNVDFSSYRVPEIHEISDEVCEEPEHIPAADEPDIKPLYRAYEVRIL